METARQLMKRSKKLLLIDDDLFFCNLMSGARKAIELGYYDSALKRGKNTLAQTLSINPLIR